MTPAEIDRIANIWLRQYRSILGLNKAEALLKAQYGAKDYAAIRGAMALKLTHTEDGSSSDSEEKQEKSSINTVKVKSNKKGKRRKDEVINIVPTRPFDVDGTIIHPDSLCDEKLADKLLVLLGDPNAAKKLLTKKYRTISIRRPNLFECIDNLFGENKERYIERHEKWVNRKRSNGAFEKKVAEQNARFEQSRKKECYGFKLIYTPMGNKR